MTRTIVVAATMAVALVAAMPAWAKCKQSDIAGRWDVYVAEDGYATICDWRLSKRGRVKPRTRCYESIPSGPGTCNARVIVSTSCEVRRNCGDEGLIHGTMTKGGGYVGGLVFNEFGEAFSFQAIKR